MRGQTLVAGILLEGCRDLVLFVARARVEMGHDRIRLIEAIPAALGDLTLDTL